MVAEQSNNGSVLIDLDFSEAITLDKVFDNCDDYLLSVNGRRNRLQDTCLSFCMFSVLLANMAGYDDVDTKLFGRTRKLPENAFYLVQTELRYLCEYLFTNYYVIYDRGLWKKFKELLIVSMFFWISVPLLVEYRSEDHNIVYIEKWDNICTRSVIVAVVLIEFIQVIIFLNSKWAKVMYVCYYLRYQTRGRGSMKNYLIKMVIRLAFLIPHRRKPLKRKIGQYSILKSYTKIPFKVWIKCWIQSYMDLPRIGVTGDTIRFVPAKILPEIINSVDNHLQLKRGVITDGTSSLQDNGVAEDVIQTYVRDVTNPARGVLIWHIVTCWFEEEKEGSEDSNFEKAAIFSKYCAYLGAFAPEMLSDQVYTTECEFDDAIKELQVYSIKKKNNEDYTGESNARANSTLKQARNLKEILEQQQQPELWKTLAEFWTERLFYLALSDHTGAMDVHADSLCFGGEFITHLWALLTHAGCSREPKHS